MTNLIDLFDGVKVTIEPTYTPEAILRQFQGGKARARIGEIQKWEEGRHLNFDRIIVSDEREPERDGPYDVIIGIDPNNERRSIGDLISNPPTRHAGFATVLEILTLLLRISERAWVQADSLKPLVGSAIACPGSILSDDAVVGFARKSGSMRAFWIAKTYVGPYFRIKQYGKIL